MTAPNGHVFPKWGPRGPFRVYTWTHAAVTGIGLVVAALMMVAGLGPQAITLVGLLGALLIRDSTGIPSWTRVGQGLGFLVAGWTGRRSHSGDMPLLGGVEVHGYQLPGGVMGIAADRGRYLGAMRVAPTANPWLASVADREVAADDWARVVASIPLDTIDRLQVLTITRTGGSVELLADAEQATGPGFEVAKEVAHLLADRVRHIDSFLIVRLNRQASREADHRGGVEAAGHLLHVALQHLGSHLPTEGIAAEILAPSEWRHLIDSILHQPDETTSEWEESWTSVRMGRTWHRGVWVWDWPQRPTAAGFLSPLICGEGDRVVSLVIEPADPEPRQRTLDFAFRRAEAALATATGGKHRKQADLDVLDRQLTELNQGHIPIRALLTAVVSTPDRTKLDDLAGTVRSNAVAGLCRATVPGGSQPALLASVLPLCRGLDPGVTR